MRKLTSAVMGIVTVVLVALPAGTASAAVITNTSQIHTASNNPYFAPGQIDLVGVNFYFLGDGRFSAPSGKDTPAGTVNGVGFDNIDCNVSAGALSGTYSLTANGAGPMLTITASYGFVVPRGQDTDIAGTDDTNLEAVANENYHFNNQGSGSRQNPLTLDFTNLGVAEGDALYVQLIGGAYSNRSVTMGVSANDSSVGNFTITPTANVADLFAFETTAGPGGSLDLELTYVSGYEGGIAGLIVSSTAIPEPASLAMLGLGSLLIAGRRHRRQ